MQHELVIDGDRFRDYEGFVAEFNSAYLAALGGPPSDGEPPWNGEISDLHELLEAAVEATGKPLTIRWIHSRKSSADLGHGRMADYCLRQMAGIPASPFSPDGYQLVYGWSQERLDQARAGEGRTLFEYLVWQLRGEDDGLVDLRLE